MWPVRASPDVLPLSLDHFAGKVALVIFVWLRRCVRHGNGEQQECDGAARGQPQVLQPQPWHRGEPKLVTWKSTSSVRNWTVNAINAHWCIRFLKLCWSSGRPDCLFSCNDHPSNGAPHCYLLLLFVYQSYSTIFVHSSNHICVPLIRYLCRGAAAHPHRAAWQLPLGLPGGRAGSCCVSWNIAQNQRPANLMHFNQIIS